MGRQISRAEWFGHYAEPSTTTLLEAQHFARELNGRMPPARNELLRFQTADSSLGLVSVDGEDTSTSDAITVESQTDADFRVLEWTYVNRLASSTESRVADRLVELATQPHATCSNTPRTRFTATRARGLCSAP